MSVFPICEHVQMSRAVFNNECVERLHTQMVKEV